MVVISLFITKAVPSSNFIVFAYIDPGSGSILLQFLIATLVGATFYFRRLIASIIQSIRNKLQRKPK